MAVEAMRRVVMSAGHGTLLAPVRPSLKHCYPLIPMDRYIEWTDDRGQCFDPWLRTHLRAGAKMHRVAPQSMTIRAEVSQWQAWIGWPIPGTGRFIVPDALVPVEIDEAMGIGTYTEPNVWMLHVLDGHHGENRDPDGNRP